MFIHKKSGKRYIVLDEFDENQDLEIQIQINGEWVPAIKYRPEKDCGKVFIRSVKEFNEKFEEVYEDYEENYEEFGCHNCDFLEDVNKCKFTKKLISDLDECAF